MKITKSELKKLIAEEIDEVKLAVDTRGQGGISQQQYLDDMRGPWYYEGDDDEDQ